ncbi:MAG: FxsA family protein [Candidatus Omnitrophica bacterium]|nr:FxsA family protein [Candidatus Omnitrophota bacterium]
MGFLILILFIGLPVAEIYVMGRVAAEIGGWNTFSLLIFSAVFGLYLTKIQGRATLVRVQQALAEGRAPTTEMLDGLLIFLGGVFFIIPGFISDVLGLLLLFPLTRWLFKYALKGSLVSNYRARTSRGEALQPRSYQGFGTKKQDAQDAQIVE